MARADLKSKLPHIFIDGEAGTTGLGIRQRLAGRTDMAVISIDPALRKDAEARREMMKRADVTILCLPDEAAKEAVALNATLGASATRIVDASTAHRTAPGWVYGFPELSKAQTAAVANANLVANPGCYPTGAIALIRPLIDGGLMAAGHAVTVNAVSGYTGGGKSMIEAYEAGKAPAFELYGLGFEHKHVPELQAYSNLTKRPIFIPSVGNFAQGMLVSIPVHLDMLKGQPSGGDLHKALSDHYRGSPWVSVISLEDTARLGGRIEPEALNDTNKLELLVFSSEKHRQAVLVARLDNLGKGASGAAVQNVELMLGLKQ